MTFLVSPLKSLFRIDILLATNVVSLAFIDLILVLFKHKNGTYLCGIKIFIDATFNSPTEVDPKIMFLALINLIVAQNSS